MAKKKTVSTKKKTAAAKKQTSAQKKASVTKKKPPAGRQATPAAKKKTGAPQKRAAVTRAQPPVAVNQAQLHKKVLPSGTVDEYLVDLLPQSEMRQVMDNVQMAMNNFQQLSENNLTLIQRRRKIGAGVRNYGFIEKVADLAEANPQYAQFFDPNDLRNAIMNFDMCRDLVLLLQSFARMVSNTMLVYSNEAFTISLIFYNMVREMGRRGDPTALELFRTLQPFFKRPKRASAEPTEKELERDLHSLIHGAKDGEVIVKNIAPRLTAGERKVVDDVHKGKAMIKETAEAQEED